MNGVEIALAGYLAFGQLIPQGQQEIVKHVGLQVLHADGAVTLRLKETGREKRAEDGAEVTTIRLVEDILRPRQGVCVRSVARVHRWT